MKKEKRPILLSGIQPSGHLMIGNYAGAIRNWVALQSEYDCLFMVVDMHAITVKQPPAELRERCLKMTALYLACGVDPDKSTIFIQSHVPAHAELAWVLNCYTQMGQLNRMTQYKEKGRRHTADVNVGLFDYPVLMAADILLHQTSLVPVGDDQRQHLELTRDIAARFNNIYGEVFRLPEPYVPSVGARIMSLQNPQSKMSKSDPNPANYLALLDSPDEIRKKLARAVTDTGKEVVYDEETKPGIANLMTIYSVVSGESIASVQEAYIGQGYAQFKKELAERVVAFLTPIQRRYCDIVQDPEALRGVLCKGAEKAAQNAQKTLACVYDFVGFVPRCYASHDSRPL